MSHRDQAERTQSVLATVAALLQVLREYAMEASRGNVAAVSPYTHSSMDTKL